MLPALGANVYVIMEMSVNVNTHSLVERNLHRVTSYAATAGVMVVLIMVVRPHATLVFEQCIPAGNSLGRIVLIGLHKAFTTINLMLRNNSTLITPRSFLRKNGKIKEKIMSKMEVATKIPPSLTPLVRIDAVTTKMVNLMTVFTNNNKNLERSKLSVAAVHDKDYAASAKNTVHAVFTKNAFPRTLP